MCSFALPLTKHRLITILYWNGVCKAKGMAGVFAGLYSALIYIFGRVCTACLSRCRSTYFDSYTVSGLILRRSDGASDSFIEKELRCKGKEGEGRA